MRHLLALLRLVRVCALPRDLLGAHLLAYGLLARLELQREVALWRRRALLQLVALGTGLAAAVLGGVALMLWAVVPLAQVHSPWALWAVPLAPGLVTLGCLWAGRSRVRAPAFAGVRRQLAADLVVLRGARTGPVAAAPDLSGAAAP
ncbi:hypothetical protein BurJ1DRAFT_1057 [Burkholderiales bacterium JOSHI_001]|nr:hypothetical protein BurJ1DRAFT_1057 [Burkholderiales bacterium JOSHI_001]